MPDRFSTRPSRGRFSAGLLLLLTLGASSAAAVGGESFSAGPLPATGEVRAAAAPAAADYPATEAPAGSAARQPPLTHATEPENSASGRAEFVTLLFVLMLATFIGLEVIRNVSRPCTRR